MTAPFPADTPFTVLEEATPDAVPRPRPSEIRAADYRQKALDAAHRASSSGLANVRQRHEAAAVRWLELAGLEDDRAPVAAAPALRSTCSKAC